MAGRPFTQSGQIVGEGHHREVLPPAGGSGITTSPSRRWTGITHHTLGKRDDILCPCIRFEGTAYLNVEC